MEEREKEEETILSYVKENAPDADEKKLKRWLFMVSTYRMVMSKIVQWVLSWIPLVGFSMLFTHLMGLSFGIGDMLLLSVLHMLLWGFKLSAGYDKDILPLYREAREAEDFLKCHLKGREGNG